MLWYHVFYTIHILQELKLSVSRLFFFKRTGEAFIKHFELYQARTKSIEPILSYQFRTLKIITKRCEKYFQFEKKMFALIWMHNTMKISPA